MIPDGGVPINKDQHGINQPDQTRLDSVLPTMITKGANLWFLQTEDAFDVCRLINYRTLCDTFNAERRYKSVQHRFGRMRDWE